MKAQMKFQKYICIALIIVGALALFYAFSYCTGSMSELGQTINETTGKSYFIARPGKNDALLFKEIQSFNTMLMYFGIIMILLSVLLFITSCHRRRNYYISNYVATGVCAGGNIVLSIVAMIMNGIWKGEFLNVDFERWLEYYDKRQEARPDVVVQYHILILRLCLIWDTLFICW